jgi:hypothetical protein
VSGPDNPDGCGRFRNLAPAALKPGTIHRLIVGHDSEVKQLSQTEATEQLGDPFATLLLLKGTFPNTAGEILAALDKATKPGDPLRERSFFFVGEATQIPGNERVARHVRFLVTTGRTGSGPEDGPDLMFSVFHPDSEDAELMAWDRKAGGFNYYRTAIGSSGWIFAGNSRHALEPESEFKGPFESHASGNFIMKELKLPWVHWHSFSAPVTAASLPPDLRKHPWIAKKDPSGAATCEIEVAIPSVKRWTKRRFERLISTDGVVDRPERVMRQVLKTDTVNLHSSETPADAIEASGAVGLPPTFVVDADTLSGVLGLQPPPFLSVASRIYRKTLERFDVRLTDRARFDRPGDTHFCFVIPERALEDVEAIREAIRIGLFGKRFAASLLMVDFANPVFSPRREQLLAHAPTAATVRAGKSGFAAAMVKRILAAAERSPDNSPEREFAKRWQAGAKWRSEFNRVLANYYAGLEHTITTQAGFDRVFRVAETRRRDVIDRTPLVESPLLFATTNVPPTERMRMRFDGTAAAV